MELIFTGRPTYILQVVFHSWISIRFCYGRCSGENWHSSRVSQKWNIREVCDNTKHDSARSRNQHYEQQEEGIRSKDPATASQSSGIYCQTDEGSEGSRRTWKDVPHYENSLWWHAGSFSSLAYTKRGACSCLYSTFKKTFSWKTESGWPWKS